MATFISKQREESVSVPLPMKEDGKLRSHIFNFQNAIYQTDNPEVVDAIRNSRYYGYSYWEAKKEHKVERPIADENIDIAEKIKGMNLLKLRSLFRDRKINTWEETNGWKKEKFIERAIEKKHLLDGEW